MSMRRHRGTRPVAVVASAITALLVLVGCGAWPLNHPDRLAGAPTPGRPATTAATPDDSGTPVAALRRLYAVVDRLDGDPALPVSRLDAVAVGPARGALTSAVRQRRADDHDRAATTTQLSQIVVRPSVRSEGAVTAALQFCSSRQIDARSGDGPQELQPTTITFRYDAGRWRAYLFGFVTPDCGCSQPIQCG